MSEENNSFTTEYREMLDFISELQESALQYSDQLLAEKKEIEYKKRQQEYVQQEKQRKKIPNISMFSPLSTEDMYDEDIVCKDELEKLEMQLSDAENAWEKQKRICLSFERLKDFFARIEKEIQNNAGGKNEFVDYSTKLLETQEMDRNRISRDLHDSTVQSLTSLIHKTEYCSKMIDKDPVRAKLELQTMIDLNKEIINDMREIIYDLRPMSINNIGLVSALESYCLHLRRYDNFDVILSVNGAEENLSSIVRITLYRIIQEACNNAIRHSKAKKVYIKLAFLDQSIELDIEDNGIGFDTEKVDEQSKEDSLHGFGLYTMRERARLLSGAFFINSKPGMGTKIHVVVPRK